MVSINSALHITGIFFLFRALSANSFTCPSPEAIERDYEHKRYYIARESTGSLKPKFWTLKGDFIENPDVRYCFSHTRLKDNILTCWYHIIQPEGSPYNWNPLTLKFNIGNYIAPKLSSLQSDILGQCLGECTQCKTIFTTNLLVALKTELDFYKSINADHIVHPDLEGVLAPYYQLSLGEKAIYLSYYKIGWPHAVEIPTPDNYSPDSTLSIYNGYERIPIASVLSADSPSQLCAQKWGEIIKATKKVGNGALTLILKSKYTNGILTSLTCEERRVTLTEK